MLSAKRTITVILTSLSALLLACCECDDCNRVTYEVDGTAAYVSVYYNNPYGDTEYSPSVALPWKYKFSPEYRSDEYQGGVKHGEPFPAYLEASVLNASGHVTVRIYVDGKLKKEKSTDSTRMTVDVSYAVK